VSPPSSFSFGGPPLCYQTTDFTRSPSDFSSGTTPVRVTNDSLLLSAPILRASAPWGICVVAGTGSVISGVINEDGVPVPFARRGGHGHIFGDEGSGESTCSLTSRE
jgi:N-acetylglucosamine kinase-like BadF-type ATPase